MQISFDHSPFVFLFLLYVLPSSNFMSVCCFTQLQLQKTQYLQLGQNRGQYYGGSLPNVNQIGNSNIDLPFQVTFLLFY